MSSSPFREEVGSDGLVYRTATQADWDGIWRLMLDDFFPHMPLFRHLGIAVPSDVESIRSLLPGIIAHGVTVLAEDPASGELVGVRTATVAERDRPAPRHPLVADPELADRYPKASAVLRLVDSTCAVDCHRLYGVARYLSLRFLVVRRSHCGRGLGRSLMESSLRLARRLGLELAVGSTQNYYAQRIYQSMGFDRVHSVSVPEFVDPLAGERPFEGLADTVHRESVYFAKRLM